MRNFINRITIFFVALGFLVIVMSSCEKHDFLDENIITGEVGPQAYWEVGSTTASAGSNVPFLVQYYSTSSEIDHAEVWYNITERIYKSVSCPWITTFTYSITSETTQEKRISQKIQEYSHSLAVWSDSLHAYTFTDKFPVSGTLGTFSWNKPEKFDSTKMATYFGTGYMQHFKDSLYTLMKFADFQKMILGMNLLENFKAYTDSTFDDNSNTYVYHFPKDANGNTPVPSDIENLYKNIPFDKLIESASGYDLEYKRSYSIDALLRVYDTKGVYAITTKKTIEIN